MQGVEAPYGELRLAGSGFRLEHDGGGIDRPPPLLGEHTDEILKDVLRYSAKEIADIKVSGAITAPEKKEKAA
jgi:crotonobetainyl-CoA:carnitine CoA-transferase CaiB-like acyl-CoA transferase